MDHSAITALSRKIHLHLKELDHYVDCSAPLFFASFRSEVDTHALIRRRLAHNQAVYLPVTRIHQRRLSVFPVKSMEDLVPGAYGILEPTGSSSPEISPSVLDLVIVPGSVFDRRGGRYGYGGGFYDRFLAHDCPQAVRVALAFSFQVLDNIPLMPHDQLMDYIVTEKEIIRCSLS